MEQATNNIEDYPDHWDATLCGKDFWEDAEEFNRNINDEIEANHAQTLHTRFPFNLAQEQNPRAPSVSTNTTNDEVPVAEKRSRRRFSMSDAMCLNSLNVRTSLSFAPSRVIELARRSRSHSRSRSSSVASDNTPRRSNSLLRSTFTMLRGKKREEEEGQRQSATTQNPPILPPDQATPANPLMEFRGGGTWAKLPRDRRTLGIDVFWPTTEEDEEKDNKRPMLAINELAPMFMFRNLRVLKITGMMQSYQKYIWQAAWLNTNLDELELGMALQPRFRRSFTGDWPYMKGGWELNKAHYGEPVYYGGTGQGSIDGKIGTGEYLDKMIMEKAKICAMAMGRTRNRFSIRTLVLTGFIVDADPFLHWFDTKRLKCINFKDYCVDAGFYLSLPMKKVSILFPCEVREGTLVGRRVNLLEELKVVELKGGKKVGEIPYRGPQSLKQTIPQNVGVDEGKRGDEVNQKENIAEEEKKASVTQ